MAGKLNLGSLFGTVELDTSKARKAMAALQSSMRGAVKAAAAAGAAMAAGLAVATKAASEQIAAERKLEAAIKASGKAINSQAIKDYAAELQKTTTFGDEATIAASSMLVQFGANEKQIISLLPHVQNLAAGGADLNQVMRAVGMSLKGDAGLLSRYGLKLDDASKKAFQLGSMQERVNILLKNMGAFAGQAEAAASTATGRYQQFKNAAGDLMETIGMLIESDVASFFQDMTASVNDAIEVVQNYGPVVKNMAGAFADWLRSLDPVRASVAALVPLMFAFGPQIAAVATAAAGAVGGLMAFAAAFAAIYFGVLKFKEIFFQLPIEIQDTVANALLAAMATITKIFDETFGRIIRGYAGLIAALGHLTDRPEWIEFGDKWAQLTFDAETTLEGLGLAAEDAGINALKKLIEGMGKKAGWAEREVEAVLRKIMGAFSEAGPPAFLAPPAVGAMPGAGVAPGGGGAGGAGRALFADPKAGPPIEAMTKSEIDTGAGARAIKSVTETTGSAQAMGAAIGNAISPGIGGAVSDALFTVVERIGDAMKGIFGEQFGDTLQQAIGGFVVGTLGAAAALVGLTLAFTAATLALGPLAVVGLVLLPFVAALVPLFASWGAVLSLLIPQTESFAVMQQNTSRLFGEMVHAVEPIMEIFGPVLYEVAKALAIAFVAVTLAFYQGAADFTWAIKDVLKWVADLTGVKTGWTKVKQAAINLDDAADAAERSLGRLMTDRFEREQEAAEATREFTDALRESAYNMPAGYRVAAAQFEAQNPRGSARPRRHPSLQFARS